MIQVKKALVVDDSRLARIALSKLLQRRNVDVDMVGTGTEALNYLRTTRPDVVFMDYMMPDMDGFEATRRIRSLPGEPNLPVIMYTAQESEEDLERAKSLGIAGFLIKPSGEESLEEVLESLRQLPGNTGLATGTAQSESATGTTSSQPEPGPAVERGDEPAVIPEPPQEIPWDDIRAVAREVAEAQATEVWQFAQQRIDSLREELAATIRQATDAAREASGALAEQTAQRIARETVERIDEEYGPEASEKIKAELRRELRSHMAELLAADIFRQQFTEIVLETALPRLREVMIEETRPQIQEQILDEARHLAQETARIMAAEAARNEANEQIAVSLTDHKMQTDDRIRELVQANTAHLRRSQWMIAGIGVTLILAGIAASVYLSAHGILF